MEKAFGDLTLEELKAGGLKLRQPRAGYRYSLDSLLLADFMDASTGSRVLELGAGCGVISLLLADKFSSASLTAIEVQPELADLARQNIELNSLSDRIEVITADWRRLQRILVGGSFDAVVTNPPFRRTGQGRVNLEQQKAIARFELKGGLGHLLSAAVYSLKNQGALYLVHLPERLPEIMAKTKSRNLNLSLLRFIHPKQNEVARHLLLKAVKNGRQSCEIAAPLFVYGEDGGYTPEAGKILAAI